MEQDVTTFMTEISGADISLVYNSDCTAGSPKFDKGYLWIKSYIYDHPPSVMINNQRSDVFYFINNYNLIGTSFTSSIYNSFGINDNLSLNDGDRQIMFNLSINGKDSTWKINPDITIKRQCNGAFFDHDGDSLPANIYYSSALKNFKSFMFLILLL